MTEATKTVIAGTAFFDLEDYVRNCTCTDVAAQMAQSIAFAIDVNINSAVRQLMKNLREYNVDHGIDTYSEMVAALEDSAFAEEVMRQAGKDDLGPVATILQLNTVRDSWHMLASELTSMTFDWQGVPRTYEIKPVEEMLLREVKLQVKPQVAHRIKVQVQRRAEGVSQEDIDAQVAKRLAREEQKLKEISETLQSQQGAIVTLFNLATQIGDKLPQLGLDSVDGYSDVQFYQLDTRLRKQMIEAALKGAARAEEFATSSSNITDSEFDDICFAVMKVERELKAVLQGPAYTIQRMSEMVV